MSPFNQNFRVSDFGEEGVALEMRGLEFHTKKKRTNKKIILL